MTIQAKLSRIREQMKTNGVSAYVIPSADAHISEYLPDRYKCIELASGFTGSVDTLVITKEFAGLWTDFRYFVHAGEQLNSSGYELVKLNLQHTPEFIGLLHNVLPNKAIVAFNDRLFCLLRRTA